MHGMSGTSLGWTLICEIIQLGPLLHRDPMAAPGTLKEAVMRCAKCSTPMTIGKAIRETVTTGIHDDIGGDVQTYSVGGPGVLIECWKCPSCGYSVTK